MKKNRFDSVDLCSRYDEVLSLWQRFISLQNELGLCEVHYKGYPNRELYLESIGGCYRDFVRSFDKVLTLRMDELRKSRDDFYLAAVVADSAKKSAKKVRPVKKVKRKLK
jgi:hypothetical protein